MFVLLDILIWPLVIKLQVPVMKGLFEKYNKLLSLLLALYCTAALVVYAGSPEDIPPPKQKYSEETLCVEPVEVMRKQHFEFMLEHRDETVIEGIRTKKHSLNECIDCHITANSQGEFARYSEDTHFCASCHQFAAVNIDCFQCHADRPEEVIRKAKNPNRSVDGNVNHSEQTLKDYLELSDINSH
jgi:hypothetical protein